MNERPARMRETPPEIRADLVYSVKSRIAKGVYPADSMAEGDKVLDPLLRAMRECRNGTVNERVTKIALLQLEDRLS